jgi:hypothetical protein
MKPEAVKQTYTAHVTPFGQHGNLLWEEIDDGITTKEHVLKLAQVAQADIMAVGLHGRKGPKE